MNIYALTFASHDKYRLFSEKLKKRFRFFYNDIIFKEYTALDLSENELLYAQTYPKGFGYWIWKPRIVNDNIRKIDVGDILIYLDCRCNIYKNKDILKDFSVSDYDMIIWKTDNLEHQWSSAELINAILPNHESTKCEPKRQYAATFMVLKKNNRTLELVDEWKDLVCNRLKNQCRDEYDSTIQHSEFIENRHDQSVFSLLIHRAIENNSINVMSLDNSQVYSEQFIKPHHFGNSRFTIPRICRRVKRIIDFYFCR